MNKILLLIVIIPIIEIYLFIKIGAFIGAFNTIALIFITDISAFSFIGRSSFIYLPYVWNVDNR